MRSHTILTKKEMASVLGVQPATIDNYLSPSKLLYDPKFPVIKIGTTTRFIKEKVVEYWRGRKNISNQSLE